MQKSPYWPIKDKETQKCLAFSSEAKIKKQYKRLTPLLEDDRVVDVVHSSGESLFRSQLPDKIKNDAKNRNKPSP